MNEKELIQDLKTGVRPVYVLYGEESYLTARYADKIASMAVTDDMGGFNLQKLDGETAEPDHIVQAVEALPLMADTKCVVVRDLDITAGDTADKIMPLITAPVDTAVLVLMYMRLQPQSTKNEKWKTLLNEATKNGAVVKFSKKTESEIIAALCAGAARRNCTLRAPAAALLVQQCGDDMLLLTNELDKLAALADGGDITEQLVSAVATKNLEMKVYDLSKAILRRRGDEAFALLDGLMQMREEPIAVLAVLISAYVDMYRMKVAVAAGKRDDDVADLFAVYTKKNAFRLRYAAQDAARMSIEQLRQKLEILAWADTTLKSSRADARTVLEQTVAKLLG